MSGGVEPCWCSGTVYFLPAVRFCAGLRSGFLVCYSNKLIFPLFSSACLIILHIILLDVLESVNHDGMHLIVFNAWIHCGMQHLSFHMERLNRCPENILHTTFTSLWIETRHVETWNHAVYGKSISILQHETTGTVSDESMFFHQNWWIPAHSSHFSLEPERIGAPLSYCLSFLDRPQWQGGDVFSEMLLLHTAILFPYYVFTWCPFSSLNDFLKLFVNMRRPMVLGPDHLL